MGNDKSFKISGCWSIFSFVGKHHCFKSESGSYQTLVRQICQEQVVVVQSENVVGIFFHSPATFLGTVTYLMWHQGDAYNHTAIGQVVFTCNKPDCSRIVDDRQGGLSL